MWLVPSLVGGAVSVTFIGVFLGPIYPIVMNHSARILPRSLLTGSIGWIAGFGQAGSAVIPFLTGAIASSKGIWSLQPLYVYYISTNHRKFTLSVQDGGYDGTDGGHVVHRTKSTPTTRLRQTWINISTSILLPSVNRSDTSTFFGIVYF